MRGLGRVAGNFHWKRGGGGGTGTGDGGNGGIGIVIGMITTRCWDGPK